MISKSQIDRLGNRLRQGIVGEDDLRMLDDYRRSFGDAYQLVVSSIRNELHLSPTGRPAKSTSSVVERLKRESIRLSQIQDIAGCRIVVPTMTEQDNAVESIRNLFPTTTVVDRRQTPTYGYRAVHVMVKADRKLVEIQVRSRLQHLWAEYSEKLSDVIDPKPKYGGGPDEYLQHLASFSLLIAEFEDLEREVKPTLARIKRRGKNVPADLAEKSRSLRSRMSANKKHLRQLLRTWITQLKTGGKP